MNTSDLPPGCQWAGTVEHATQALAAGHIPLLTPASRSRADRWADVMRWYDPSGYTCRPNDDDMVIVSTTTAKATGNLAAAALNRPHHHIDTLTDTGNLPTPRSVLVVIPAGDATMSAITRALDTWSNTDTRVGLLTGRDQAGIVFSLAKILAARTSHRSGLNTAPASLLLDGPTGRALRLPNPGEPLPIATALTEDWTIALVDAHGTAAHAWLGTHVLCGLTEHQEHSHTGHPIRNGCLAGHCKLSPSGTLTPAYPHTIRTTALGLFVCNAIALGHNEQYPSDVALALDALDGYPAAVFGLLRGDADTSALEPTIAAHLLHAGTSLGDTAHQINLGLTSRGLPHSTLLLGDPNQTPPAVAGATIPAVEITALPNHPVVTTDTATLPALITPNRALITTPATDARIADAEPGIADLLGKLRNWTPRLLEAELVEEVLHTVAPSLATADFLACLETMRCARSEATHLVHSTTRDVEKLRKRQVTGLSDDPEATLDHLAQQWATAVANLAVNSPSATFETLTEALTAHHHSARNAAAGPCDLCRAPRRRDNYASPLKISNRTEVRCARCGLASSSPDGGAAVILHTPTEIRAGQPVELAAMVDDPRSASGVLALQLRPRTSSQRAYASHVAALDNSTSRTVTLDIPADAEPELHRVWALLAWRFQLSITLARIPAM